MDSITLNLQFNLQAATPQSVGQVGANVSSAATEYCCDDDYVKARVKGGHNAKIKLGGSKMHVGFWA